ncbi:acetyltransferase [Pseudogemmobacter blasticus]|uniref:Acetyltransferase n=1 Tax=Fuscovulum blasticum DSM 2131 TaxID=1188250 RepID=A0A2T4J3Z1_FUSBL|nr:acetyltransferase [Fuscovulum blasticum]PTE12612.1 acetyltransferase [Fuscovulum blasticum DSM 2131]
MKATETFEEITVFGARGHSLMILRGLEEYWRGRVKIRALIDDIAHGFDHPALSVPVISSDERLRRFPHLPVLLTVSNPGLRGRVARRLQAEGATLATAICPERINLDPAARFGPGSVCMPWTRIGPDVTTGPCTIMLASIIAHDVEIGAFTTLAGDALVSGHVRIGDRVSIAPRAVIANGHRNRWLTIGDDAEIGVGAAVLGNVAAGERVIGNPAMPIRHWVRLRRLARGKDG